MIPKTIHYCWFNDTPIPYSLQVCMDSWKKNLPDYKWKLWSLKDFDVNSLFCVVILGLKNVNLNNLSL